MAKQPYKKPTAEQFRQIVEATGGNLSSAARSLKVTRGTITFWIKTDPEFEQVVREERQRLFDEALATARLLMVGLPAYEIGEDGKKRFAGWIERPSESMVKLLLTKFGREEGFGDDPFPVDISLNVKNGIPIRSWIERENAGNE